MSVLLWVPLTVGVALLLLKVVLVLRCLNCERERARKEAEIA